MKYNLKKVLRFLRRGQIKKKNKLIKQFHLPTQSETMKQMKREFEYKPLISIVTPLYNTNEIYLKEMLESVIMQTYSEWELCLADGSDESGIYVEQICRLYAEKDYRIKYRKLKRNLGIVGNTNECIKMARGEYIGLLDHDDVLHPYALYNIVNVINNEKPDFIYTDEIKFKDKIQDAVDIVCKSGFGKDELRAHNYICHFTVFKKILLDNEKEAYRKEFEGSQDYDMVLRMTEQARKIVHIPKVLYYWRLHSGSVSMDLSVKHYAVDAAKLAISNQLERLGEDGNVECNFPYETIYRIDYVLRETPKVTIVLWGEVKHKNFIEIVKATTYRPLEIVLPFYDECIVEDDIKVETVVRKDKENKYHWFNRCIDVCNGKYIVFMKAGCLPQNKEWIEEMLMYVQREDVCVVGPHILGKGGQALFAGAVLDNTEKSGIHVIDFGLPGTEQGYEANIKHVRNTSILSEWCMMVSVKHIKEMKGFDENVQELGDADFCLRGKEKGYLNVWTCFVQIYYNKKAERVFCEQGEAVQIFGDRWRKEINQGDEYCHPFLRKLNLI